MIKKASAVSVGLLLLASPLVLTFPWKEWFYHSLEFREAFTRLGFWAPWAFGGLTCLGTAVGLPRLIFCFIGGWLFGFEFGFAWSQLGSLLGAYLLFLLARGSKPEWLLEKFPKLRTMGAPIGTGWVSVLIVRQLPLAGLYNDVLLGWSHVSHRDFWIGSFLGFLPLGITATLMGAGAIQTDMVGLSRYLAGAALAFILLPYSLKWLISRRSGISPG